MLRGILLDYGGTLVVSDSFDAKAGFYSVFETCDRKLPVSIETMVEFATNTELKFQQYRDQTPLEFSFSTLLRSVLDYFSLETIHPLEYLESIYYQNALNYSAAEGVIEFLIKAKRDGIGFGVISNTNHRGALLQKSLQDCGFGRIIDVILSSADYGIRKQMPLLYDIALAKTGFAREEVVFVGDNLEFDIQTAQNAGLKAILYNGKRESCEAPTKADFVFETWKDITHKDFEEILKGR